MEVSPKSIKKDWSLERCINDRNTQYIVFIKFLSKEEEVWGELPRYGRAGEKLTWIMTPKGVRMSHKALPSVAEVWAVQVQASFSRSAVHVLGRQRREDPPGLHSENLSWWTDNEWYSSVVGIQVLRVKISCFQLWDLCSKDLRIRAHTD